MFRRSLLTAPVVLAACSSSRPDPAQLDLEIHPSAALNPNAENQPSPLLIRLYDLRDSDGFMAADFFELYDRDSARLGGSLLSKREMLLVPNRPATVKRTMEDGATVLGVLAAFRVLDGARWRAVWTVKQGKDNVLSLDVGANTVTLAARSTGWF